MGNIYNNIRVFKKTSEVESRYNDVINDEDWVVNSLLVGSASLDDPDNKNRYWSSADYKFYDTSLGGSISLNVWPQFTSYCDIRSPGTVNERNRVAVTNVGTGFGMGRFYSETIDDNSVNVYLTFGVPEFNSMFTFLTSAVDYSRVVIANRGRATTANTIGKALGFAVTFIAFPIITPLIYAVKGLVKFLSNTGRLDYYYMKPTMFLYWSTVNTIVTMMATELGILSYGMPESTKNTGPLGLPMKIDQEDMKFITKLVPNLIKPGSNYIDVFAIALKGQRLANQRALAMFDLYKKGKLYTSSEAVVMKKRILPTISDESGMGFVDYVNAYVLKIGEWFKTSPEDSKVDVKEAVKDAKAKLADLKGKDIQDKQQGTLNLVKRSVDSSSFINNFIDALESEMRMGGKFAVFKVDYSGTTTYSFRNNTGSIPLEDGIKSITTQARDFTFSMSGGNILPSMGDVLQATKDLATGAIDTLTFGLGDMIASILGDAYLELPKRWVDSDVTLPMHHFTMKLIAPYGNPISQLRNIYIPLAAILAGALPRSTGPVSYTSPFLCSMYLRGHHHVKLGMITSLVISKGTSNLAYNKSRRPLAFDVSFAVTDFSKILAVPTPINLFDPASGLYTDDNSFNQFIAALTGRDLYTTMNSFPKLKIKMSRLAMSMEAATSPAAWGFRTGESAVPEFIKTMLIDSTMQGVPENF